MGRLSFFTSPPVPVVHPWISPRAGINTHVLHFTRNRTNPWVAPAGGSAPVFIDAGQELPAALLS